MRSAPCIMLRSCKGSPVRRDAQLMLWEVQLFLTVTLAQHVECDSQDKANATRRTSCSDPDIRVSSG